MLSFNDLSNADVADGFLTAISHSIITERPIRLWADNLIAETEIAPTWMIDLSFCAMNDAAHFLKAVPGDVNKCHSEHFFLGFLGYHLILNDLTPTELRDIGFDVYLRDDNASPNHWGLQLELAIDAEVAGWGSKQATQIAVDSAKLAIDRYTRLVPEWMHDE